MATSIVNYSPSHIKASPSTTSTETTRANSTNGVFVPCCSFHVLVRSSAAASRALLPCLNPSPHYNCGSCPNAYLCSVEYPVIDLRKPTMPHSSLHLFQSFIWPEPLLVFTRRLSMKRTCLGSVIVSSNCNACANMACSTWTTQHVLALTIVTAAQVNRPKQSRGEDLYIILDILRLRATPSCYLVQRRTWRTKMRIHVQNRRRDASDELCS